MKSDEAYKYSYEFDKCIAYVSEPKSFDEAQKYCQSIGGQQMRISSDDEKSFFKGQLATLLSGTFIHGGT